MSLAIRPYHWFFALVLSALLHGWVIYNVNFFQSQPVEKTVVELPFTVLLSDQEVVEEMVLEDPEALSSDVIPLVSLDEGDQPVIEAEEVEEELSSSGESLELIVGAEEPVSAVETAELALEQSEEITAPSSALVNLVEGASIAPELPSVPSLSAVAVLSPESLMDMREEEVLPSETLELSPLDVAEEMPALEELPMKELMLDEAQLEEVGAPETNLQEMGLPEVSHQPEVILAEITVEQIEFDEMTMNTLPQVTAEEWKPGLPSLDSKQAKGWKGRYRGASGISAVYRKQMRTTLTQFVLYPKAVAEEQGIEGKVVIGFTINREGRLEDTEILESSGHPALDQAVEKMVEFAQPFTQLPKSVNNDKVRFAFPVTIKLKR